MVKEFGNNTNDSSEGSFGQYEGACPFNAQSRDIGDDSDDSSDDGNDEEDPEEDPKEELDGIETQEKGVVCEG